MSSRLTALTLALGGTFVLQACATQNEAPAPIVFRTPTATTPAVVTAAPLPDTTTTALAAPDARGVADRGAYQVMVAQGGDSLSAMAGRVGLSPIDLANYNGLPVGYMPSAGEELVLPPRADRYAAGATSATGAWSTDIAAAAIERSALPSVQTASVPATAPVAGDTTFAEPVVHTVAPGETLFSIARLYDVPVTALADWNGLGADFELSTGQRLEVPFGASAMTQPVVPTLPQRAVTVVDPDARAVLPGVAAALSPPPSSGAPLPEDTSLAVEVPASPELGQFRSGSGVFSPPVAGAVLRPYAPNGADRNEGIDFAAASGAPVSAAGDGEVALVSRSVGDLDTIVMVRHDNNLVTVYGRITGVTVARGDRVERGQQIGVVADRPEPSVQFQVRRGIQHVNPAEFL